MSIDETLLEVREYTGVGYAPVADYDAWRVAVMNYTDRLLPQNISSMERHTETDEVFVLLRGRCTLFVGEGQERVTSILAEDMQLLKVYNVKKATWHTHIPSRDAVLLIVENRDTTDRNSFSCPLDEAQRARLMELADAR